MTMTHDEKFSVQRERLRALLTLLEVVPTGARHNELLERAHSTIADIKRTRAAQASTPPGSASGWLIDYAASSR